MNRLTVPGVVVLVVLVFALTLLLLWPDPTATLTHIGGTR